ncbi:MAG TPA: sigma factor-like helix-turn-helix DNA-binding protein, partial [Bacillota bacterium]|nr:sigma factor-like helix-turn-helix DNA-binding protein [Bacillota bacterium]
LDLARVRLERDEDTIALDQLHAATPGPDQHAELADALTEAFTKLLTNLSATERAVFLLREAFDFDYADIAPIVERSEENCRQILKRARERLLRDQARHAPPSEQERRVVQVFQEAVTTGELERLLNVLAEEAVLVRDGGNLSRLAPPPLAGAALLAELFRQHQLLEAIPTRLVVGQVLGEHLLLAQRNGATTGAILFQLQRDQIRRIRIVSCPALLRQLQLLSAYSFPAGTQPTEDQQETLS